MQPIGADGCVVGEVAHRWQHCVDYFMASASRALIALVSRLLRVFQLCLPSGCSGNVVEQAGVFTVR